ncbi:MAG TPA: YciI family protein [Acidimicrobiales bacterium]|nr:YciI family protein [Acidimicrobiales bacterium]
MSKFMISFGAHAMDHLPDEVMPDVAQAARAVVQEIISAGVFVVAGGLSNRTASIVATDGTVTEGPQPEAIGGVTIVDVPTRDEAIEWAAKIAVACRCAQEVWEVGQDPELEAMLRQAGGRS